MLQRIGLVLVPLVLATGVQAQDSVSLTLYSSAAPGALPPEFYRSSEGRAGDAVPGYGIVRQERSIQLSGQREEVRFTDVAALIDPTTVSFVSLTDPGTHVLEQNYQFDLVSSAKLMERYLDRVITVEQVQGERTTAHQGTLLSTDGGLVLQDAQGGVQVLNSYTNVRFPELPGGLITRPTLVWEVSTDKPGKHRVRVSYQTGGMTWWADYNLLYREGKGQNACTADVGAWVSIINQSGADYPEVSLKLVAGDVHRAPTPMAPYATMAMERTAKGFEQKSFFEYHLYTLGRPTSLPDNSTKQIELFPTARGVQCEKKLTYEAVPEAYISSARPLIERGQGVESGAKVSVDLALQNRKGNRLGIPLPAGRIRVNQQDPADGSLEFIGEDVIGHTPKDETVRIRLGSAFDVVGERRQIDFRIDTARRWMEEDIEVTLRNHKEEAVEVDIRERLYRWTNWEIVRSSHRYQKEDAAAIRIPVQLDRDAEARVRYTVRYTW